MLHGFEDLLILGRLIIKMNIQNAFSLHIGYQLKRFRAKKNLSPCLSFDITSKLGDGAF